MSRTPSTPTPEAEAEAPSFIDRVEALTDTTSLASLLTDALTATEAEYVTGRMMALDAVSVSKGAEASVARYVNIGEALALTAKIRINTGLATNTKGATRDPLPSGHKLTDADVRDAFNLREAGDKWTPNVPGATPVGRTECQRYLAASTMTPDTILAARTKVKPEQVNNARILVEEAAKMDKRDAMGATKRAEQDRKDAERAAAKAEREAVAKRSEARLTEASEAEADSLVDTTSLASASLAEVVATIAALTAHRDVLLAEAEARYQVEINADDMLAKLAAVRGISVEAMRGAMDALPVAS